MPKHSVTLAALAVVAIVTVATAQDQGIQSIIGNVFLQNTTPGTAQIGHATITGTFRAGQVFVQQGSTATIPVVGNNVAVGAGTAIGGSFSSGQQSGIGVRGTATSTTGSSSGVFGESRADFGTGVFGSCAKWIGVEGISATGVGVFGGANGPAAAGVQARNLDISGPGLLAENTAGGDAAWFFGNVVIKQGKNISATTPAGQVVLKSTVDTSGADFRCQAAATAGNFTGISAGSNNMFITLERGSLIRVQGRIGTDNVGRLQADVKNFVQPDPDDIERDIVYACVEGPEAAAYVRGTSRLVRGVAHVDLPRHFQNVSVAEGMTIQLTPRSGDSEGLATVSRSLSGFDVHELRHGQGTYEFDWEVKAVRRGFTDYKVTRPWDDGMLPNTNRTQAMASRRQQAREVYGITYGTSKP
ncbi:MAG: hypothetical protein JSS66_18120 [Armatimonadetes bacterium]|nr:hypothetical protein [Armatimonadota bacterium]